MASRYDDFDRSYVPLYLFILYSEMAILSADVVYLTNMAMFALQPASRSNVFVTRVLALYTFLIISYIFKQLSHFWGGTLFDNDEARLKVYIITINKITILLNALTPPSLFY